MRKQDRDDEEDEDNPNREQVTNDLAVYLWENYIDPYDTTDVFFVGIGSAYTGAIHLLNTRDAFYQRVSGIFCFLSTSEYPIRHMLEQADWSRPKWYHQNGLLLVDRDNEIWEQLPSKKAPKRYGTMVQSPHSGLHSMLMSHQEAFYSFIQARTERAEKVMQSTEV